MLSKVSLLKMKINAVVLAIALLLCKVHAQFCGPPILPPPPLHQPPYPNPPPCIPTPQITPVVGTTVIDTSLSSALANVLQLLIVSDLIESTLNTALGHHSVPVTTPVCEPVVSQPIVYTPTVDVVTPVADFFSPPCSPIIDYVPPRGPIVDILPRHGPVIDYLPPCAPVIDYKPPCHPSFDFIPQYGPVVEYAPPCPTVIDLKPPCPLGFDFTPQFGPVIDYLPPPVPVIDFIPPPPCPVFEFMPQYGPIIDHIPPSGPMFDFAPPCASFVEPLPNFYGECLTPIQVTSPNYCGGFSEYVTNVTPMYGMQDIIGPIQVAPVVPNCYNGLTEVIGPRPVPVGPVPTEILYPSNVPAQMTCSIGNVPTTLPFVSVDPMPCGYGNNILGNTYFY